MNKTSSLLILTAALLWSCQPSEERFDASGIFEAREVIISAEVPGRLTSFDLREGQRLRSGQLIGTIDCMDIMLQRDQIRATIKALSQKQNQAGPQTDILEEQLNAQQKQVAALEEQLQVLEIEQQRVGKLVKAEAAPDKQFDDVNGQVQVLQKQIEAARSQENVIRQQISSQRRAVSIQNRGILSEQSPMEVNIQRLEEQLEKCALHSPFDGTVLLTYAEENELAAPGKALYKIASLDTLTLRAYITGNQLANTRLNQVVEVHTDNGEGGYRQTTGHITWISDKAEFTPKTIRTKDERANLVYAIKIGVPNNNGYLKIGMYGEVLFSHQNDTDE